MRLMIFHNTIYKEYLLPNENNLDFEILLDRLEFGLQNNIVLKFESVGTDWLLHNSCDYSVTDAEFEKKPHLLISNDVISVKTITGESFHIIAIEKSGILNIYKKYSIHGIGTITIGMGQDNTICYEYGTLVSKRHAAIFCSGNKYIVEDYSTNGVFVDGKKIHRQHQLKFGECIQIFGLQLVFLDAVLAVGTGFGQLIQNEKGLQELKISVVADKKSLPEKKVVFYNRPPRVIPDISEDIITIEGPPAPQIAKKMSMIGMIGPSLTMAIPMMMGSLLAIFSSQISGYKGSVFLFTGLITAIGSAIIGTCWALYNQKQVKLEEEEQEKNRFNAYGNYLVEIADSLRSKYSGNIKALYDIYPAAEICCEYNVESSMLWNRNITHKDMLFHRLGVGNMPFQVELQIPDKRFSLINDPLLDKPQLIQEEFKTLINVPVGIDLKSTFLYGVVGGKKLAGGRQILCSLLAQIAANNCYTDVKIIFLNSANTGFDPDEWSFIRWFPHVWSPDKNTRYVAQNEQDAADVFYELTMILRQRAESSNEIISAKPMDVLPHYIIFLTDPSLLEGEILAKYILEPKAEYGVTTFVFSETAVGLPNACENIIQNDGEFSGYYNAMEPRIERKRVLFDNVSILKLEKMARRLSDIQMNQIEGSGDIPSSLDFMEMFGVNMPSELKVAERWRKNRTYQSMKALIGKKNGNTECMLDIHEKYHGPHGLVAGTTGSGKSELLQTYILSLAINYSPDDLGFLLIDFKGGGMANLFSDLPHLVGKITNLSGNQVRRAMISIKSENLRRQRIFSDYNVNNINQYTRLYKSGDAELPIPHLLIIIDEFAELKKEEPDFMRELISVAQVGRSLGVHLILATQKPSGSVDDNIWSNSKFRLCLRVQDKQDSMDMLHKPDAAYITQAGRCYMQVGNDEIYDLFQSGWSGALFDDLALDAKQQNATMLTSTGKTALVGSAAIRKKRKKSSYKWYKQLSEWAQVAREELNQDLPDLDVWCAKTIDLILKNSAYYGGNPAEYDRIYNFLSLWPAKTQEELPLVENILEQAALKKIPMPEKPDVTQLEEIIRHLDMVSKKMNLAESMQLWLPPLSSEISLNDINQTEVSENRQEELDLAATVGICDDPVNQAQYPIVVDFHKNGNVAVCGGVVSGKSTFLQTLAFSLIQKYSPERLNLYMIDFSSYLLSSMEKAPQVGGVITENQLEKVEKFFMLMDRIIYERKEMFQGGNFSQYIRVHGHKVPAIIIFLDGMANFKDKTEGIYEENLVRIAREGIGYGIYLVISSGGFGSTEIGSRLADNMNTVFCLEMGDRFKYRELMRATQIPVIPEPGVRGRGLAEVGGQILEFQTALVFSGIDDYSRTEEIRNVCEEMSAKWQGVSACPIPEIPTDPVHSQFARLPGYQQAIDSSHLFPLGYDMQDASVCSLNLARVYCFAVLGKARAGKTNLIRSMIQSAAAKDAYICIMEFDGQQLKAESDTLNAKYIQTDEEMYSFLNELTPEFVSRNKKKHNLQDNGKFDKDLFEAMQTERQIFIFIEDLKIFLEKAYNPEEGVGNMSGFLENITDKGELHNIFIIASINMETASDLSGYQAYRNFIRYKTGILLGGPITDQRVFNFSSIPFVEASKALAKGVGLIADEHEDLAAQKVRIPQAGR